jgi:hypothetical protein
MWFTAAGLLLVAWLPGALVFRLPIADRPRRAALTAEERLFWAVVLSTAGSSIVVLVLAALGRYSFGRLLAADAAICAAILLGWRRRLRFGDEARRAGWSALIPLALVVLGAVLFFPVAEHVIGGKDPGVYVSEGIQLAQRGSLVVRDQVVASVPLASRDLFFPSHQNPAYYSLRFMGFFILDPRTGTTVGQFPHLFPAWLAIGYGLGGLAGALDVTAVCAMLGLLALYFAGARLVGRTAASIGAALLGISIVEVWFARDPNSDMLMQALLFEALVAFSRAHVDGDRFFAPVSGTLLGLLFFLRFDSVLALAGVGMAAVLLLLEGRRPRLSFVVPLVLLVALGWLYLTRIMSGYAMRPLVFLENLQPLHLALIGAGLLGLGAVALAARRPGVARALQTWIPRALVGLVLAAAGYAYFLRQPGGRLAWHDAMALRVFTWYLPAPALAAALAGFALVAWRRFWRDPALLVTATVFAFFVFYKIQIVPDHFWMARRFVPIILPFALLMVGALVAEAFRRGPEGRAVVERSIARAVIAGVFLLLVAVALARQTGQIRAHVEYRGIVEALEQLAGRFGDADLVLVESRNSSDMHVLALPLADIYGRNVLVFNSPRPDKRSFREFLEWTRQRYRNVYFVGGGGTDLLSRSIAVEPIAGERFQVPEYESRRNAYPRGVRFKEFDFGIYRFIRPGAQSGPVRIDVGREDDLSVVRFHAKERTGDISFRWTRDVSYVSLPGIQPGARTLTMWLNDGGRPPSVPPARVAVYFNGQLLGEAAVTADFHAYEFPIPGRLAADAARQDEPALVKIVTSTWNPQKALGTMDQRDLGVMVNRVEVR